MATYNLSKTDDCIALQRAVKRARELGYTIDVSRHYEAATDKQRRYLDFLISYYSLKYGQSFFATLRELQQDVCPHVFATGETDKRGNPKYKKLCYLTTAEVSTVIKCMMDFAGMSGIDIPMPDDDGNLSECMREVEQSGAGWGV